MQYLSTGSVNLRPPQICLNYAPFIRNNDKYVHVASVLVYCEPGHNQISLHICEVEVGRTNGRGEGVMGFVTHDWNSSDGIICITHFCSQSGCV